MILINLVLAWKSVWKMLSLWNPLPAWQTWQPGVLEVKHEGKVDEVVEEGKAWRVKHNSTLWLARSTDWIILSPGDEVKVVGRKGLILFIEPLEMRNQ